MVSLQELREALEGALKGRRSAEVSALRLLLAALHNREIEKRTPLADEDVARVLSSEAKKRKESIELFRKGGREDLAEKEEKELSVLERFLPALLPEAEVRREVRRVIEANASMREFGPLMKLAMAALRGKAEAKVVADCIKEEIERS